MSHRTQRDTVFSGFAFVLVVFILLVIIGAVTVGGGYGYF
ncbi:MAG: sporulation protein YjcZ [Bacillus sp. (in: Bacteria)]|nr:sporulation protein YjcZ [Bacillus sp. (in: firmicutes)]